jgi:hypothetical protein
MTTLSPSGRQTVIKVGLAGSTALSMVAMVVAGLWRPASAQAPPIPVPRSGQTVVQFVNESRVTLLLAAFGPTAIEPREGTWTLRPGAALTVDIPPQWHNTTAPGSAAPRFWARTGCRFDESRNVAQCETGDWAGMYDAFKGAVRPFPAGKSPNSFTEWCFICGDGHTFWDVSAVDGADLSVNIQPLGSFSPRDPTAPGDVFWCRTGNAVAGADLRASCPDAFQLKRSQLSSFIQGSGDGVVACFSNCGKYKYPLEPPANCTDATDPRCSAWKRYCCTAGPAEYARTCNTDADCGFGDGCLELTRQGKPVKLCQCRGWVKEPPCPDSVCTNQGLGVPPYGTCSGAPGPLQCIGDDTVHRVLPRAYTWPNDPQTYNCDAKIYRVTFAPGGTKVPITDAGPIPACSSLPAAYDFARQGQLCENDRKKGAVFAGAHLSPGNWQCRIESVTDGVLCRWP